MQIFSKESAARSKADLDSDRDRIRQNIVMEDVKLMTHHAKAFLRNGLDSINISRNLEKIRKWHDQAGDGVFKNKGSAQTSRNLTTTYHILAGLSAELNIQKGRVDRYQSQLIQFRFDLDSLSNDESLFKFPKDSTVLAKYLGRLQLLAVEIAPVSKQLDSSISNIQNLQTQLNLELFKITSHMEEIDFYQKDIAERTFDREFVNIWEESAFDRPFSEIAHFSFLKLKLLLAFYLKSNWFKVLLLVALICISTHYIRTLRKATLNGRQINSYQEGELVIRYPLLSATTIVISIFQYIFIAPPFAFNGALWLIAITSLSFIFRKFISLYWLRVWLAVSILFTVSCVNNLILQASRAERWVLLTVSALAFAVGIIALFNKKRHTELKEQWILYPIGVLVVLVLATFLADIFGRYNLAKVLLIAGLLNVVIAILFLWVIRLVNGGLQLASSIYTHQEKKLFYINYNRVGTKAPIFFYFLLVVGWFVVFGRNFYEFRRISEPLELFFQQEHVLGSYTFSISNLLVFLLIMILTTLLSKVVSYFAADQQSTSKDQQKNKFRMGSWILLIRITIVAIGLFLAFAAVGIPMDKITLIMGALGVGIGFGLQTLVNNLVSGLIIAFEKPVNVGDQIEVSGQGGIVKSIGFRSSVISTLDGADLVLPNGDLLNSHVINWTQGGQKKRMYVTIGIAYNTDLKNVRTILLELLQAEHRILSFPEPTVQYSQFAESRIDISIYFWVKSLRDSGQIRSDIIENIHCTLLAHGIVIPFPQQELFIHTSINRETNRKDENIDKDMSS